MKDQYPRETTLPAEYLVPEGAQPEYAVVDLPHPEASCNVGYRLADAQVEAGRGSLIAAVHAESRRTYTFAELAQESSRLAAGLVSRGVKTGDRIAYRTTNDPDVLVVMLGIWKAGGVVVPVPVQAKAAEIRHIVTDTGARQLFVHAGADPFEEIAAAVAGTSVEDVIDFGPGHESAGHVSWNDLKREPGSSGLFTDPDQVAIIWHTGGTTGRPKGCYHTHRRFLLGGYAFGKGAGVREGQRWASAAPIGHALGIIHSTIFTLLNGATVVFVERFTDPQILLRAVADHRITTLTALMTTWAKMADAIRAGASNDLSSLSRCYAMWQSASAMELFDFWVSRGITLLNNFGSTSFATWVLVPPPGEPSPRAALGRALPGYQVEAVEMRGGAVHPLPQGEIGQMAVRGPTGLTYWNLRELQRDGVVGGWTLSDDLIRFDESGNAHYLGRTDYVISTGGYKVAPVEVEQALSSHPAVREVAVVPGPCPIRQQMVVAYIVVQEGVARDDRLRGELQQVVKSQLSAYKTPRRIEFIDALPRDPAGKVQTKIVMQWASATSR